MVQQDVLPHERDLNPPADPDPDPNPDPEASLLDERDLDFPADPDPEASLQQPEWPATTMSNRRYDCSNFTNHD